MLNWYEQQGQSLIWRSKGETLMLTPWGTDSIRVRSVLMGDIRDDRFALLDPDPAPTPRSISMIPRRPCAWAS